MSTSLPDLLLKIKAIFSKPRVLLLIIGFETLIIASLLVYIFNSNNNFLNFGTVRAQEDIDQAVSTCYKLLPPQDKLACAESVGVKIAILFPSPEDQLKQCLKLRPLPLFRYCQQGYISVISASPTPTPSPASTPESTPSATPESTPSAALESTKSADSNI